MGTRLGPRAMTNAERQAKWRAAHKGEIQTREQIIAALREKLAEAEAELLKLRKRKRKSVTPKSSKK